MTIFTFGCAFQIQFKQNCWIHCSPSLATTLKSRMRCYLSVLQWLVLVGSIALTQDKLAHRSVWLPVIFKYLSGKCFGLLCFVFK